MSISFSWKKLPVDSNGKAYDSLEAFQASEIAKLLKSACVEDLSFAVSEAIVGNKTMILEILELTLDARPSARGKPKPRKAKQQALPKVQAA